MVDASADRFGRHVVRKMLEVLSGFGGHFDIHGVVLDALVDDLRLFVDRRVLDILSRFRGCFDVHSGSEVHI